MSIILLFIIYKNPTRSSLHGNDTLQAHMHLSYIIILYFVFFAGISIKLLDNKGEKKKKPKE